jgi:pimeloyl-ACP methyl ester carboxylesterase
LRTPRSPAGRVEGSPPTLSFKLWHAAASLGILAIAQMPFVTSRGSQIHYSVEGEGPLVILLHGLLSNAKSWKHWGFVDALADRYRVACVDSLGHGLSDKPSDDSLYGLEARSRDVVAVIDDLGFDRAHVVGYSMGGWLSVGVAKHHRHRLSSLIVGGWDIVHGAEAFGPPSPAAVKWWAAAEPGLRACWEALADRRGAREAVVNSGVPVLLWSGRQDPSHEPMRTFAATESLEFLSTGGSHNGAIHKYGAESGRGIRAFLDACPG